MQSSAQPASVDPAMAQFQLRISHHPASFARPARQYDDAVGRNSVVLPVLFVIVTDLCSRRNDVGFVYDAGANRAASADLDPVHDHRVVNLAISMDAHVSADDAVVQVAVADDGSLGDDGVARHALTVLPV